MATSIITKARRKAFAELTSGRISTIAPIAYIVFGDGGVGSSGEPLMPDENQEILVNEIARFPANSITYPTETTVRYTVVIPEADMVGAKISEVGLVDSNNVLCAVKNMYVKQKDDGVKFTFEFDDEF